MKCRQKVGDHQVFKIRPKCKGKLENFLNILGHSSNIDLSILHV